MTHPGEVGLDWAINRQKPFFVGVVRSILSWQQTLADNWWGLR